MVIGIHWLSNDLRDVPFISSASWVSCLLVKLLVTENTCLVTFCFGFAPKLSCTTISWFISVKTDLLLCAAPQLLVSLLLFCLLLWYICRGGVKKMDSCANHDSSSIIPDWFIILKKSISLLMFAPSLYVPKQASCCCKQLSLLTDRIKLLLGSTAGSSNCNAQNNI